MKTGFKLFGVPLFAHLYVFHSPVDKKSENGKKK